MKSTILLALLLLNCTLSAQQIISTREEAVGMLRELRKIHTPNGIETLEQVELNGEKQWISIRGKDKSNPVLLFIHGGPASPMMPISWAYQNGWEDYFTVVQWDQRVSGKNWLTSDTALTAPTIHRGMITRDAAQLVFLLCDRLEQDKIFIMGYSFGSMIGIKLAALIPDKIQAFISVGQVSPGKSEQLLYSRLLDLATAANNDLASKELQALAPYPNPNGKTPVNDLLTVRKWARKFNGGWYGKQNLNLYFDLSQLSPEYTSDEIRQQSAGDSWVARRMMQQSNTFQFPLSLEVPIVFMMGLHDLQTPYSSAKDYFDEISAPHKSFHTFENSAHFPMLEEPGKFLVTLVNQVLPLATSR